MTDTLISLISILIGIIGANLTGFFFKKYSFDLIGNTIAGVFGSIFFIKSFGRIGFDPISIMESGRTNVTLFLINTFVSFLGGSIAIIIAKKLENKMNNQSGSTSSENNSFLLLNIFKVISFLEGVSYILLLFVGVPLKYFGQNDFLVKSLGMPHGILFIAYVVIALLIRNQMNWDGKTTFIVLVASLLPFGTFYINKKYCFNRLLLLLGILLFQSACQNNKVSSNSSGSKEHNHDWGYDGAAGTEDWATLSPEFIQCAEGHFQSPIDLESYSAKKQKGEHILEFKYHPSAVDIVDNGHTIQTNVEAKDEELIANGNPYGLKQFHFHAPAEHQIDGIIYPMEMHLVHSDQSGKLAVVGVFIKEGIENEVLQNLWEKLPDEEGKHTHSDKSYDLLRLLPEVHTVFHYSGSLTTPPCSEGVEWFVMKNPIELSKKQIEVFKKRYHGNNRNIQKLENRTIEIAGE